MNKILLFILCIVVFFPAFAQTVKLWGENPPARKMKYSELTLYLAPELTNTGVSVIICPGGSYCYLGMKGEGHKVAQWLNTKGINAFVLRYRVGMWGNHYPAMIQDLQRAIQYVREKSTELGLKSDKIGVMGFSAGGHLAGTAGIYYEENFMESLGVQPDVSLRPDFVAMIYPVVSMNDSLAHRKSRRNLLGSAPSKDMLSKMSLEENVHPGMPPVFLMHCKDDETVDVRNSQAFSAAMQQQQLSCSSHFYARGDHGFGISPKQNTDAVEWPETFVGWLHVTLNLE